MEHTLILLGMWRQKDLSLLKESYSILCIELLPNYRGTGLAQIPSCSEEARSKSYFLVGPPSGNLRKTSFQLDASGGLHGLTPAQDVFQTTKPMLDAF